jgi:hypothetical protein
MRRGALKRGHCLIYKLVVRLTREMHDADDRVRAQRASAQLKRVRDLDTYVHTYKYSQRRNVIGLGELTTRLRDQILKDDFI